MLAPLTSLQAPPSNPLHQPARIPATVPAGESLPLPAREVAAAAVRSGFLTSAAARGASIFKTADQSRHKSMDTLRGYVRDAEIFKDHAGRNLL
jgi:hypothetical protein